MAGKKEAGKMDEGVEKKKVKESDVKEVEEETTEGSEGEKKGEKSEGKEGAKSGKKLIAFIVLSLAIIIFVAVVFLLMPRGKPDQSAAAIASAIQSSNEAMGYAEKSKNLTILRDDGKASKNGTGYLVSFPVKDSDEFDSFDVLLDKDFKLLKVGFDEKFTELDKFIAVYKPMNAFQACARVFNTKDVVPTLISKWINGTQKARYIMTMPKSIECNGANYTYSLELGDGYVTTTINGYYTKNGFNKGIVVNTMKIPAEDVEKGVYVYIDRVGIGKLRYSYELRNGSSVSFDKFADNETISKYKLKASPSLVWNCKFVNVGTKATGELNGTFSPGSEELALKTFGCVFNNGEPEKLCSEIGVTKKNGSIAVSIPSEYLLTMYETGLNSCKVGDVVNVEAFYNVENCLDCENQRKILNKVAEDFGDKMNLTYYCVGPFQKCRKLIDATKKAI